MIENPSISIRLIRKPGQIRRSCTSGQDCCCLANSVGFTAQAVKETIGDGSEQFGRDNASAVKFLFQK